MKSTKRGARSKPSIGPTEALEILESAINYCRSAGLAVKGGNVGGALTLEIAGAELTGEYHFAVKAVEGVKP
jgi:hypothetical protein